MDPPHLFATTAIIIIILLLHTHIAPSSSSSSFQPSLIDNSARPLCHHEDATALLEFKSTLDIDYYSYGDSFCDTTGETPSYWKMEHWEESTDCCSWNGVGCDESTGRVIELDLSCGRLKGVLTSNSSIFRLSHLQRLDLAFNNFLKSNIPPRIGELNKLTHLNLSFSSFQGPFPLEISNLSRLALATSLEFLDLSYNQLTGHVPSGIGKLTKLVHVDLSANLLNSTVPSSLFSLPSLNHLDLSSNKLSGHVGPFESNQLQYVDLGNNTFEGVDLPSILNQVNLTYLNLESCNLSGTLEFSFRSKKLQQLSLSNNKGLSLRKGNETTNITFPELRIWTMASCNVSVFPYLLQDLDKLVLLDLQDNIIHSEIQFFLAGTGANSLVCLDLSWNFLTGHVKNLPWKNLQFLNLASNLLEGPLLDIPPKIKVFFAGDNNLSGEIDSVICNLHKLRLLDLSNNSFTGKIPSCVTSLEVVNLKRNNFKGSIPQMTADECGLVSLDLSYNQLEGTLPPSFVRCNSSLNVVNLQNNLLSGTFPHWLEDLTSLQIVILSSNNFSGTISSPRNPSAFAHLAVMDLSHNKFVGEIPSQYFDTWTAMMEVDENNAGPQYIHDNSFYMDILGVKFYLWFFESMIVVNKGNEVDMKRILDMLRFVDFSSNEFTGKIPSSLGKLQSLTALNLSNNMLNGDIPWTLMNLTRVESLDLSSNNLSGQIPPQLSALVSLSNFNVSNNKLEGPVPQGKQFDTFLNDSYLGNPGLCGPRLTRKCPGTEVTDGPSPATSSSEKGDSSSLFTMDGFTWKPVTLGYVLGIVIGILTGVLFIKEEWILKMFNIR